MPRFEWSAAGISLQRPWCDSEPVCVVFVVEKVALGLIFLQVQKFTPVSAIPPMLRTHSFSRTLLMMFVYCSHVIMFTVVMLLCLL
jgi:hypothetical protein